MVSDARARALARRSFVARALAACALVACALALGGCGPWVPVPEAGTHEGDEPVIVPYPPPVPHVEVVPRRPKEPPDRVWIDGQWLWRGRRWTWEPGRWEPDRPGSTYAPPAIVYLPDRRIGWFAGRWRVRGPRAAR